MRSAGFDFWGATFRSWIFWASSEFPQNPPTPEPMPTIRQPEPIAPKSQPAPTSPQMHRTGRAPDRHGAPDRTGRAPKPPKPRRHVQNLYPETDSPPYRILLNPSGATDKTYPQNVRFLGKTYQNTPSQKLSGIFGNPDQFSRHFDPFKTSGSWVFRSCFYPGWAEEISLILHLFLFYPLQSAEILL